MKTYKDVMTDIANQWKNEGFPAIYDMAWTPSGDEIQIFQELKAKGFLRLKNLGGACSLTEDGRDYALKLLNENQ
jgi:hypothetical protein